MKSFQQTQPFKDLYITNIEPREYFSEKWGASARSELWPDIFHNTDEMFSGYFFNDSALHFSSQSHTPKRNFTGNFSFFSVNQTEISAYTDIFGLSFIYLYQEQKKWAISNRYELIIDIARSAGKKLSARTDLFIRSVTQRDGCFAQRHSRKSDIEGISLLALDQNLTITRDGIKLSDKKDYLDLLQCERSKYEFYLDAAAQEIIKNIESIYNSKLFDKLILDLSGGFDSRALLAAAVNCQEKFREKTLIRTHQFGHKLDLQIATTIADSMQLNYLDCAYRNQEFFDLASAMETSSSYFLGEHFYYGLPAWSNAGRILNTARISGGCGELYRSIYVRAGNKAAKNPVNFSRNSNLDVEGVQVFDPNQHHDTLDEELANLPGDATQRAELHHNYYHLRTHYGMRAWDNYHDILVLHPLQSINLYKASRALSIEERCGEKVMLDITNRLFPLLTCFPYEVKSTLDRTLAALTDERFNKIILPLSQESPRWTAATNSFNNHENALKRKINTDEASSWRNIHHHYYNAAKISIKMMADHDPALHTICQGLSRIFEKTEINREKDKVAKKIISFYKTIQLASGSL